MRLRRVGDDGHDLAADFRPELRRQALNALLGLKILEIDAGDSGFDSALGRLPTCRPGASGALQTPYRKSEAKRIRKHPRVSKRL